NEVIVLDSGTQQLEIDFKALHFAHPDRVRFRYRLAGFHNDWNEGETLDSVRYQKLPPGSYNFEVIADNGHGIWSPSATTLALTVLPQWWESWWFRLIAFACVGAIVLGLVQWRLRLAKARSALLAEFSRELIASQESERKRVAGELHDSIGQEMLVLKGRLDMAAMKNPELKPALKGLSTDFSGTIERTRALSHDLRPPHLERLGLSESLEAKVVEIEEASKLEVNSKIEDLQPRLHPDLEIGLFRIAQEAVSNVLKHAQASRLGLQLGESDGIVTLFIDDDGQGFEPDIAKGFSLGLSGMAERAQLMGGSFKCDSSPGRGTRITVQLRRSNPSS
ncbi:MAG: ATP-binding protein, partial [Planctomycetota bacterium]